MTTLASPAYCGVSQFGPRADVPPVRTGPPAPVSTLEQLAAAAESIRPARRPASTSTPPRPRADTDTALYRKAWPTEGTRPAPAPDPVDELPPAERALYRKAFPKGGTK